MAKTKKLKAGRKPVADKKVPVVIYIRQSIITKLSKEKVQQVATQAVEGYA